MFSFSTPSELNTCSGDQEPSVLTLEDRNVDGRLAEIVEFIDHNSLRTHGVGLPNITFKCDLGDTRVLSF